MRPLHRRLPATALILAAFFGSSLSLAEKPRVLEKAEPPPPPSMTQEAPTDEPQITIRKQGNDTVKEFRLNGRLYMMQITPVKGPSYYLVDEQGDGQFTRHDALDSGLRVPMWLIKSW